MSMRIQPDQSANLAAFPPGTYVRYVDMPNEHGVVIPHETILTNEARIHASRRRGEVAVRWWDGDEELQHYVGLVKLSPLEVLARVMDETAG